MKCKQRVKERGREKKIRGWYRTRWACKCKEGRNIIHTVDEYKHITNMKEKNDSVKYSDYLFISRWRNQGTNCVSVYLKQLTMNCVFFVLFFERSEWEICVWKRNKRVRWQYRNKCQGQGMIETKPKQLQHRKKEKWKDDLKLTIPYWAYCPWVLD